MEGPFQNLEPCGGILALSSSKRFVLSKPQFPHLLNGENICSLERIQ